MQTQLQQLRAQIDTATFDDTTGDQYDALLAQYGQLLQESRKNETAEQTAQRKANFAACLATQKV